MFKISKQQMVAIARTTAGKFEHRMVRQLGKQFPDGCLGTSENDLADKVQRGIMRAALHRLTSETHVGGFIALATALGEEFDMDPRFKWADDMLGRLTPENATEVIDALTWKAAEHLAAQPGAGATAAAEALTRGPTPGDEHFSEKADVGDPVAPCPKLAQRRLYSFSS